MYAERVANGGWIPVDGALSLLCQQLPPEGARRILFWVTSGLMVKPSSSTSGQVWEGTSKKCVRLSGTKPPISPCHARLPPLGPDSDQKRTPMAVTIFPQRVGRFLEEDSTPLPVLRGKLKRREDIGPSHIVHGGLQPLCDRNLVPKLCDL